MSARSAVVIGGGISGTLLAWTLAAAGWRVSLLEAATLGAGSSSRSAAGIRQQFTTPDTVRAMRYCVRAYREMAALTEDGQSPIVQAGYLFLVDPGGWEGARARVALQREAGLTEVEALPAAELTRRFPWVAPEGLAGATWCPTDGFLLPAVVYQEAGRLARVAGARVVQNAPVIGAAHDGRGALAAVVTPKGTFEGDVFFDCTNAFSGQLAARLGATELPIEALKRYLWFVKRSEAMPAATLGAMPLVITPGGAYCRPENSDLLLMGRKHDAPNEPDFTHDDQDRIEPGFAHNSGVDAEPYAVWAALAEHLPAIGEFDGITATTAGYYGTTPDHNPFLDRDPAVPNLIRLVGFSGHGAMMGPFTAAAGLALAEGRAEVALGDDRVGLDAFAIGRPLGHGEAMVI